jgi:hypothetical protein
MVPPRGLLARQRSFYVAERIPQVTGATIAPRSIGYRPIALLLSYSGMRARKRSKKIAKRIPLNRRSGNKMVARRGNAPRSAECESVVLRLHHAGG